MKANYSTKYLRSLKWAESNDGFINSSEQSNIHISNALSDRYVHQLRAHHDAILIGKKTLLSDNPKLTTRLYSGKNPIRIVISNQVIQPSDLNIFNSESETILFNTEANYHQKNIRCVKLESEHFFEQMFKYLLDNNIASVLVEGGNEVLQSFINNGLWDEIYQIKSDKILKSGLNAPNLDALTYIRRFFLENDQISIYRNISL